jgi:hypothetical protein
VAFTKVYFCKTISINNTIIYNENHHIIFLIKTTIFESKSNHQMKKILFIIIIICMQAMAFAQTSFVGKWKPYSIITKETGEMKLDVKSVKDWTIGQFKKEKPSQKMSAKELKELDKMIPMMVKDFKTMYVSFSEDKKIIFFDSRKKMEGTYTINEAEGTITISREGREDRICKYTYKNGMLLIENIKDDMTLVWQK